MRTIPTPHTKLGGGVVSTPPCKIFDLSNRPFKKHYKIRFKGEAFCANPVIKQKNYGKMLRPYSKILLITHNKLRRTEKGAGFPLKSCGNDKVEVCGNDKVDLPT